MTTHVKTADVKTEKAEDSAEKGFGKRIASSRPVEWVKAHAKGVVAGVAATVAVTTAAVLAGRAAADKALDLPFDGTGDVIPPLGDDVEA